jgi:hypothetical protein
MSSVFSSWRSSLIKHPKRLENFWKDYESFLQLFADLYLNLEGKDRGMNKLAHSPGPLNCITEISCRSQNFVIKHFFGVSDVLDMVAYKE